MNNFPESILTIEQVKRWIKVNKLESEFEQMTNGRTVDQYFDEYNHIVDIADRVWLDFVSDTTSPVFGQSLKDLYRQVETEKD